MTINRTLVELKQSYRLVPHPTSGSINRTLVELKRKRITNARMSVFTINRTLVELKRDLGSMLSRALADYQSYLSGIKTVNTDLDFTVEYPINRTLVELKPDTPTRSAISFCLSIVP